MVFSFSAPCLAQPKNSGELPPVLFQRRASTCYYTKNKLWSSIAWLNKDRRLPGSPTHTTFAMALLVNVEAGTIPFCSPSINFYILGWKASQVVQFWQSALIKPSAPGLCQECWAWEEGAVVENAQMWALCLCRQCWLPAPSPCQFPCRLAPW